VTIIRLHVRDSTASPGEAPAVPMVPSRGFPAGDEDDLAMRLSEGDPEALEQLIRRFWEPLASYAYRLVGDRDAAMDIAQETCVRVWENRHRKPPRSLRAYLFRITRNQALDQRKTSQRRGRLIRLRNVYGSQSATPEELLERERVAEQVELAIAALPERRREVFVLAYLKGLSYREVGEVMGTSPKTVQNQMSAALSQLREVLLPLIRERRAR
jgi:RNA polymerase sigma-70 factor (ECF subfamily)